MIEKRYGTLKGLTAPILVYASIEEADQAAGRVDAARDEMNANLAYRGPLDDARELICDILEKKTGIERTKEVIGKKKSDGSPIYKHESAGDYADRVCTMKGWEDLKAIQADVDTACRNVEIEVGEGDDKKTEVVALAVDIQRPERQVKPKKLAKMYREAAENIFKNSNQSTWVGKLASESNITLAYEHEPTPDDAKFAEVRNRNIDKLGWAIKAREDAKSKERVQEYV